MRKRKSKEDRDLVTNGGKKKKSREERDYTREIGRKQVRGGRDRDRRSGARRAESVRAFEQGEQGE